MTRPIQQEQGCISNILETPKEVYFPSFSLIGSLEESSNEPSPNLTNSSSLAESVVVSTSSANVNKESTFDTPSSGPFNGTKDGKVSTNRERKIQTSGLENCREKKFSEGTSNNDANPITGARKQGSAPLLESS